MHISVFKLVEREFTRISKLVARCNHNLLCLMTAGKFGYMPTRMDWGLQLESAMQGAPFYRGIRTQIEGKLEKEKPDRFSPRHRKLYADIMDGIGDLLQNNLVLDQTHC